MYRTNVQVKAIEESFHTSGIPYQMIGEKYSLKRKEIMNFLSFIKVLINPANKSCKMGVHLPEKLDSIMTERLKDLMNKMSIGEFLKVIWDESGIKRYCSEENFMLLEDLAAQYADIEPGKALDSFINEVSLLTPADSFDPGADAVTLMTLHMAKGLEFRVVFVAGVEDGLIPYTLHKDDVDIEEERRLFYVGMTRAMDELFLIHARNRFLYGQRLNQSPSPFLREIPEEFIERRFMPDRVKKVKKDDQIGLF